MVWPTSDVNTGNADAGTDNPATFRTDVLDLLTKFNQLRAHVSTLGQTILGRNTPAQVRADLGAQPIPTETSGTTAGTGTAYTFAPTTPITAYTTHLSFWVKFHAASGANPTLKISGLATPPTLVRYNAAGALVNVVANDIAAGFISRVTLLSATQALVESCGEVVKNAAGNIGAGVEPSAWGGVVPNAVELPGGGAIASQSNASSTHLTSNCYFDGVWRYKKTGVAGRIVINPDGNPGSSLFVAPSGAAGAAITFTEVQRTESNGQQMSVVPGGSALLPSFPCRAWVNFNGTGTVERRAGGNVSSITDNGVGDYTVNFTTAMPHASYAVVGMGQPAIDAIALVFQTFNTTNTTSACRIRTATQQGSISAGADLPVVSVAIFC
jgi:hypothetical protein